MPFVHLIRKRLKSDVVTRIALLFCFVFLVAYVYFRPTDLPPEYEHLMALLQNSTPSSCRVPHLNPFDPSVLPFYEKPEPLVCSQKQEQLAINLTNGILYFDKEKAASHDCWITPIYHNHGVSDFELKLGEKEKLDLKGNGYKVKINHEFFEVQCSSGSFLNRKNYVKHFARIAGVDKTRDFNGAPSVPVKDASVDHPAVVLLGIDSMSRSNFLRQLPKTHKRMQNMGFIDMEEHVKIHDNTYGNLVALLTGKRGSYAKGFEIELPDQWDMGFDDIEMLWRNFSKNGYVTMFSEDRPDIATFNYKGKLWGFKMTPTDHYTRYIEKYTGKRHFSMWWTQDMSHDYLNMVGRLDDDLEGLLRRVEERLNNTIFVVFSDHGPRYGPIMDTVVGRIEGRLPFVSIRLPEGIKKKYPHLEERLLMNKKKMTTHFDLHLTLNEIASGRFTELSEIDRANHKFGHSLFDTSIPATRTCQEAGVPADYCPCLNEKEIDPSEAKTATEALLYNINQLLEKAPEEEKRKGNKKVFQCLPLKLANVTYSAVRFLPSELLKDKKLGEEAPTTGIQLQYRIVFKAQPPSSASIGGLVVRNFDTGEWSTTGDFERTNKYGDTSSCVVDPILRKLCYCIYPSEDKKAK